MKKFLIILAGVVLLIGGGIFAALKMVPLEALKPQIQEKFHAATGRNLIIEGDMRVTVWPDIGVKTGRVAISNASWGRAAHMMSLDEMDAVLKLMPLFEKRVEVDRFILRAPHIYLETSKTGQNNWDFGPAKKEGKPEQAEKTEKAAAQDFALSFGELKIVDGLVRFEDHGKSEKYAFDNIHVTVAGSDMNSPVSVDGKMQYRARQLQFNFEADSLNAVIAGKAFAGKMAFEADPFIKTSLEGKFLQSPDHYLTAAARTQIGDINGLLKWLSPTHSGEIPFKSLGFSTGKLELGKAPDVAFGARLDDVALKLDDLEMRGTVGFRRKSGAAPHIDADVSLPQPLDVPALMARFAGGEAAAAGKSGAAQKPQSGGWSQEVMDLSALHSMNGKFVLSHQGLIYKNLKSGAGKAVLTLSGGRLVFDMPETALDKGRLSVKAELAEAGANTSLKIDLQSKEMPVQPLLIAFADLNKLTGTGTAYFNGTARGNTQAALVSSLAGKAGFHLRNGMLHGVNFVDITKMVQQKLTNIGLGDGGTEFADFDATFAIGNGVMKNDDLYLRGPLVEAKGKGQIGLPQQTMNFRITPQMILKQAMQENTETGEQALKTTGITVPVDIYGPWTALKIKPDYAAVLKEALRDPEKIEENIKVIKEEVEKNLENLKGIEKELKNMEKPEDLLRGLLRQ